MKDYYETCPLPKGEPRKRTKARKLRMAKAVINTVRPKVVERDGYCRLSRTSLAGTCDGPSEWAHLKGSRRYETRGQAPEVRHTVEGSVALCQRHHMAYDAHDLELIPIHTAKGAEGVLRVTCGLRVVLV